jgi:hypothetical protein
MISIRKACWFVVMAFVSACWMGMLGALPGEAFAGILPSRGAGSAESREEDLRRVQVFLEQKIVRQRLEEYGVSPQEANAKVTEMSDKDLHVLALMADRIPEGADAGFFSGELVFIQVMLVLAAVTLVILVILGAIGIGVLAKYLKKKSQTSGTDNTAPAPATR